MRLFLRLLRFEVNLAADLSSERRSCPQSPSVKHQFRLLFFFLPSKFPPPPNGSFDRFCLFLNSRRLMKKKEKEKENSHFCHVGADRPRTRDPCVLTAASGFTSRIKKNLQQESFLPACSPQMDKPPRSFPAAFPPAPPFHFIKF